MSASAASQTVVAAADGSRRFGRYHFVPGGRWSPTPTGQPGSDCCET